MNDEHTNHDELHLHADPETERIESMLDALGSRDREAMTPERQGRVLGGVSKVFAPEPISMQQHRPPPTETGGSLWRFRYAAAALLASAATLGIVATQPWQNNASPTAEQPAASQGTWSLASFEEDLDAYMELDELESDPIDEAVASWEIWAQTMETEFDSDTIDHEFGIADYQNGAL